MTRETPNAAKRVLFFCSYLDEDRQAWTMHIASKHAKAGDNLTFVVCAGELPTCHVLKTEKNLAFCVLCSSRTRRMIDAITLLGAKPQVHVLDAKHASRAALPSFENREDVAGFQYREVKVGLGVASTIISAVRDMDYDVVKHRAAIEQNVRAGIAVVDFVESLFKNERIDLAYVCNGRFAESRPFFEMCLSREVEVFTYESGSFTDRVECFRNTLPQDLSAASASITACWEAGSDDRESLAKAWFEKRRYRVPQGIDPVFTAAQKVGHLPNLPSEGIRRIAVFNSSEDENASLGEYFRNDAYSTQAEALDQIISMLDSYPGIHLFLRLHPNLTGLETSQVKHAKSLRHPQLTVIPAESDIDSYALMDVCDAVLTFGSTMGAEACFWGKPSVLYGRAIYETLEITHNASCIADVMRLLADPELKPRDHMGALKYAYASQKRGELTNEARATLMDGGRDGLDWTGRMYLWLFRLLTSLRMPISHIPGYKAFMRSLPKLSLISASTTIEAVK